jgi:hypothetical protein
LQWLVKGAATLCPCRKECNKYDILLLSVSDSPIIMIGPGGLLLVVLDVKNIFVFSHILSTVEMF